MRYFICNNLMFIGWGEIIRHDHRSIYSLVEIENQSRSRMSRYNFFTTALHSAREEQTSQRNHRPEMILAENRLAKARRLEIIYKLLYCFKQRKYCTISRETRNTIVVSFPLSHSDAKVIFSIANEVMRFFIH